jgi:hypothetical protein
MVTHISEETLDAAQCAIDCVDIPTIAMKRRHSIHANVDLMIKKLN